MIWLAMFVSACASDGHSPSQGQPTATTTLLPSPKLVSTVQAAPSTRQECWFSWASQGLPDLSEQVEKEIANTGITNATVGASAYGEECQSYDTNAVQYFTVEQTDFHITVHVDNVSDQATLNRDILYILRVLKNFPPNKAPGPMPGEVFLSFVSDAGEAHVFGNYRYMMDALAQHMDGQGLLGALQR